MNEITCKSAFPFQWKDLISAISGWLCDVSWLLQLTASQTHPELHPRPPMQVAFGTYSGAVELFLHLFPSVYVFVRLYTRRHLLALVSYRFLTIWSDDYSTPPYKPTAQRRTQTLQTRTHKLCKPWSIVCTNKQYQAHCTTYLKHPILHATCTLQPYIKYTPTP